jgi:mono/diheme cytochrome c family protein
MRVMLVAVATVLVLLLLLVGFAVSGVYPVGADRPHARPVHWLLETVRTRSVQRAAAEVAIPADLDDPGRLRRGAGNYDAMCVDCHLRPGLASSELQRGLNPSPPLFAEYAPASPAAAFWVIRHGIKATGMPAWGQSMDDAYIWDMVALLQRMPELDAAAYRALVDASDGHSHGGGEGHQHDHGGDDHAGAEVQDDHSHDAGHDHAVPAATGRSTDGGHHSAPLRSDEASGARRKHVHEDGSRHDH